MKISICGTKGIPNDYGGFEQFAEYLGEALVKKGHEVSVYSTKNHKYKQSDYKGIKIIRQYNPHKTSGALGNIIYDFLCLKDAQNTADIILMCGYSSSILYPFFAKRIFVNMDGLEWKRQKWNGLIKRYLLFTEKYAVNHAKIIVDNSKLINYYNDKYQTRATYIPYGAEIINNSYFDISVFGLTKQDYILIISRIEPENNIELSIKAFLKSKSNQRLVIVGDYNTKYAKYLVRKYTDKRINFLGKIYDKYKLHELRKNALVYIHGHSVGGTNPSLLEAMASGVPIIAYDNIFNKDILSSALYFKTVDELSELLMINNYTKIDTEQNFQEIKEKYSWEIVAKQYLSLFKASL